jgi:predicted ATPase
LALVLSYVAWIESATRLPHEAQRQADEAVALSTEQSFPFLVAQGIIFRGWVLTALGQAQEGLALITQGLSMYRATGAVLLTPSMLTRVAEAYARLGQPVEGLNCLAEAAQIIESTNERIWEADVYRVRGNLLNAAGRAAPLPAPPPEVADADLTFVVPIRFAPAKSR